MKILLLAKELWGLINKTNGVHMQQDWCWCHYQIYSKVEQIPKLVNSKFVW
jgi:hypothetical protein